MDEKWEAAEDFVGSADCQILARELGDVALVYRQTTGESVSQAFHHVGVSLGGILDNLISMVKQLNNPEKLKSKKTDDEDHTFVPNRAKSNYFSNQKCRSRSSDPCYVTARGQEFGKMIILLFVRLIIDLQDDLCCSLRSSQSSS